MYIDSYTPLILNNIHSEVLLIILYTNTLLQKKTVDILDNIWISLKLHKRARYSNSGFIKCFKGRFNGLPSSLLAPVIRSSLLIKLEQWTTNNLTIKHTIYSLNLSMLTVNKWIINVVGVCFIILYAIFFLFWLCWVLNLSARL